ncbi:hypothetical protein AcV5_008900 [Taiwanofungus camphoratus]|nr:hypothetical protein AcV5_008900 [Antrodia cinnamomea]KAI0956502.1 hypothetical protein AcV7_006888 [Antrodia cinnamomea]
MIRIPLSISIDATNAAQVADAAKQVVSVFGRLDVVVNNAGYMETFKSIIDSDPEE